MWTPGHYTRISLWASVENPRIGRRYRSRDGELDDGLAWQDGKLIFCEGSTTRFILCACSLEKLWFLRTGTISNWSLPPAPVTANVHGMEWNEWCGGKHPPFPTGALGANRCDAGLITKSRSESHSFLEVWERPRCHRLHFWGGREEDFLVNFCWEEDLREAAF